MKIQSTDWKKIFANDVIDRGLISKIYSSWGLTSSKQITQSKNKQNTYIDISPKKTYRWPERHKKRCSVFPIIREMQIKTTSITSHQSKWLSSKNPQIKINKRINKKSTNNGCWRGCGVKGTLLHCWWKCKLIQPLWKTVQRFLKKLNIELPYDPAIPFLGIYLEKNMVWKDTCTPVFTAALFTIAKTWKGDFSSIYMVWI